MVYCLVYKSKNRTINNKHYIMNIPHYKLRILMGLFIDDSKSLVYPVEKSKGNALHPYVSQAKA
jgi:hypothetical protein